MNDENQEKKLELHTEDINNLIGIRKWTMFLSIIGFIFLGILVIVGLSIGAILDQFGGGESLGNFPSFLFGIIYLVIGVIYFFPILFLFQFSTNVKKSIDHLDSGFLSLALKKLRAHYTYIGVLFIITFGLYIVFGIIGSSMALFF